MANPLNVVAQLEHGVDAGAPADLLLLRARERLGRVLGDKWRLDQVLGVGGMATVYAATHRNGSRAALKILHPELSTQPLLQQQFLHEGYVANSVGHSGAVKIIDDDVAEDGSLFLVTELLHGETLEERRVRLGGRIPEDEVLLMTDQLLDVLAAAHARGVVHRDLKPENVFLTHAGQVKVLDFGIASLRERFGPTLPQPHMMMGTPSFMAPEHAGGLEDEVDQRSDLWSCGAMMFNLLSGHVVHAGDTPSEQLISAMTKRAPPLATIAPHVAVSVARVVDRALAFGKEERWRDAPHMRWAVRQAYHELVGVPITQASSLTLPGATEPSPVPLAVTSSRGRSAAKRPLQKQKLWSSRTALAGVVLTVLCVCVAGASLFGTKELVAKERLRAFTRLAEAVSTTPGRLAGPPVERSSPDMTTWPTSAPETHLVDVPIETAPKRVQKLRASRPAVSPQTPANATVNTRPDCSPPYVIDIDTGKKRWRLDCL